MRIDWFIICEAAELVAPGIVNIRQAGVNTLGIAKFPVAVPVSMVARVSAQPHEFGEHNLRLSVTNDELEVVTLLDTTFSMSESELPGWDSNTTLPFTVLIEAHTPGVYVATFTVDGTVEQSEPIRIEADQ